MDSFVGRIFSFVVLAIHSRRDAFRGARGAFCPNTDQVDDRKRCVAGVQLSNHLRA